MAKLFWLQADNTIIEFPLKAEQSLIGRSSRCDVRIKHPGISAEHALIRQVPGAATVEDLGSTNGTRVNGRRIEVHTLRHGDQIGVGRERLMYFAELDEASKFVQPTPEQPFALPAPGGEQVNTAAVAATAQAPAPVAQAAPAPMVQLPPIPAPLPAPPPVALPAPPPAPLLADFPLPEPDAATSIVPSVVPARAATVNSDMPELDIALIASLPKGTKLTSGAPPIHSAAPAVARVAPAPAKAPAPAPAPAPAATAAPAPVAAATAAAVAQHVPAPRAQTLVGSVAVLSGPAAGKRYPLDQASVTVGKEGKQVVEFVRAAPTRWQIRQREGVTPAYINGDALNGPRELAAGDVIELIGVRLRFEIALAS